jgi:SAM-dependent methyltransferase
MSIVDGWENMAEQWDASDGDEGSNWHRALLHPALLKVLGPLAGRRVLDVGCGNGSLARQGAQVTGVDASAPIIVRAQQRAVQEKRGIAYYVADAALMGPIGDARFTVSSPVWRSKTCLMSQARSERRPVYCAAHGALYGAIDARKMNGS